MDDQQAKTLREVGKRIRDARKRQKPAMTQAALATAVGLERTSITNIELGGQGMPLHTFIQISRALHVPAADLLPAEPANDDLAIEKLTRGRSPGEQRFVSEAVAGGGRTSRRKER